MCEYCLGSDLNHTATAPTTPNPSTILATIVIVPACRVVMVVVRDFVRQLWTNVPVILPSGDEPSIAYVALRSFLSMLRSVPITVPFCESAVHQLQQGETEDDQGMGFRMGFRIGGRDMEGEREIKRERERERERERK